MTKQLEIDIEDTEEYKKYCEHLTLFQDGEYKKLAQELAKMPVNEMVRTAVSLQMFECSGNTYGGNIVELLDALDEALKK